MKGTTTVARRLGRALIAVSIPFWSLALGSNWVATPAWGQGTDSGPESYWGIPVTQIRLECDAQLTLNDFPGQTTQAVGEPLDRMKVQQSLTNLFASGRFRDLRADVSSRDGGVELTFVARAAYFVGVVRVEGVKDPLDPGVLKTASGLRLGQKFDEEDLETARQRLIGVLRENAYYGAAISHQVVTDPAMQTAEIVFQVNPGKPARLHSIEFHGDLEVPIQKLTSTSGWKVRSQLTSARLERGLYRIHQLFLKRGYPQALTTILAREQNPEHNTETLALQIVAGPKVILRLEGAKMSNSKLRAILPFDREGSLDEAGIEVGAKSLRDYLERQGYHHVTVSGKAETSADGRAVEILYQVQLGSRNEFEGFEFRGNQHLKEEDLKSSVSLEPGDFMKESGRFSRNLLDGDVESLKALYGRQGFPGAEIRPEIIENHNGRSGKTYVVFHVSEGPRTTVGRLDLEGARPEDVNAMWPSLESKPGRPYSPLVAQADREAIMRYFADRGYVSVEVRYETAPAPHPGELILIFHIEPGPEEHIRRLAVLGRKYTRAGTINRQLAVKQGDPLRQKDVLETQTRLYDLGVLSQVQIAPEETGSEETDRTLLVGVEEAKRWTVGYGGGIEFQRLGSNSPQGEFQVSPRLSLEVSRLNVGGRAQTVSMRGRYSTIDKGGAISYLVPRFPTRPDLSLTVTALAQRSREVVTFTSYRREVLTSLEKRFNPSTYLATRLSFRNVKALDFPPGTEQQIPIALRDARVSMFSVAYGKDRRDEPTDATRGSYSLADSGISVKALGSQSNFARMSLQNATYHRISSHLIFARITRLAIESVLGDTLTAGPIPLPERFFLGGSESHRGFSINQAGPRDPISGYPIGGEALFFNSLELRVRAANERLGIVFFQDMGNVFSKIDHMRLFDFTQNSPLDPNFNSVAAGLGFRYKTPVGPLRVDLGYNFNPPQYQVIPDGTPTGVAEIRRLPRFQIFVGIGQSF